MTWSWRSAATAPSTRRPTGWSARTPPLHLPARRPRQRLLPDARDPGRPRRRHRAPARAGRRLAAAPRRHRRASTSGYFLFSAGVGLDASVVERVDAHPRLKARVRRVVLHVGGGVGTFNRRYLLRPPRLEASIGDERRLRRHRDRPERRAVHLLRRPPGATSATARARQRRPGRSRAAAGPARSTSRRRLARAVGARAARPPPPRHPFSGVHGLRVRSLDERPLPLQVDGDYIGDVHEAEFSVHPQGIRVVAWGRRHLPRRRGRHYPHGVPHRGYAAPPGAQSHVRRGSR